MGTPFANEAVGGGGALIIPQVRSPNFITGVSGWVIRADGSAEFNNLAIRGTFNGTNFVISTIGIFFYNGTPALGNPPITWMTNPTQTTDPFGNAITPGIGAGKPTDQSQIVMQPSMSGGVAELIFPVPAAAIALSNNPNMAGGIVSGDLVSLLFSGPALTGAGIDDWVQVITYSNDNLGTFARGELRYIDTSGGVHTLMDWGRSDQAVHIPASGGPFISGESYHSMGLPAGLSGTVRVKKLPWNKISLDVQVSWSATAATTFTMTTNFPDSTYYPTAQKILPMGHNGVEVFTSSHQPARIFVPTSGPMQIIVPATTGGGSGGNSVDYPNN